MNPRIPLLSLAVTVAIAELTFAAPLVARAQGTDTPNGGDRYTLGEVVVNGKREGQVPGQTIEQVDEGEIVAKHARSLDESLQQIPGLNIQLRNQGQPRLDIRGLPPRQVRLFLNGIPINSADDGQFDPSLIPSENVAAVKVIRGASSVLYGPGALGGVVDVITKKGTQQGASELSIEFGEGNARYVTGYHSGVRDNVDYFASSSHFERSGFPIASGGLRSNSDKDRSNFFLNTGFTPNDEWSLGTSVSYLRGSQGIPPSTVNDPSNAFASQPKFERLDDIEGQNGQFDVRYSPSDQYDARISLYVNNFDQEDNRYDNANFDSMSDPTVKTFHQLNETTVSGGQFQNHFSLGGAGELTFAFLGRRDARALHGRIRDVPLSGGKGGGKGGGGGGGQQFSFRTLDDNDASHTLATAGEYNFSPIGKAHVVFGYAHDWFVRNNHSTDAGNQLTLSGDYSPFENVTVGAAYSRDVRFPSIQELYDVEQGNANLAPERAINRQASVTWQLRPQDTVSITGFRNHVRGFIQNDQTLSQFINKEAVLRGAELSWRTDPFEGARVRVAYSYLDAEDRTGGVDNGQLDQRPRHKVDVDASYSLASGWFARIGVTYLADQTISSKTQPTQHESLANESVVNLNISKAFFDNRVTVYFGVDNLLETDHNTGPGFPLPGRFIYGGARLRL